MAKRAAPTTPPRPSEGSWRDVYVDHFPPKRNQRDAPFDRNVGLDGYDRHEGTEVPTHPTLKGPKDAKPKADPFKGH